jgi:hypothetical protein
MIHLCVVDFLVLELEIFKLLKKLFFLKLDVLCFYLHIHGIDLVNDVIMSFVPFSMFSTTSLFFEKALHLTHVLSITLDLSFKEVVEPSQRSLNHTSQQFPQKCLAWLLKNYLCGMVVHFPQLEVYVKHC